MSHEIDETYAVYLERARRARKEHRCGACKEIIAPHDTYTVVSVVFDSKAQTIKRCARCQKLHEHLRDLNPGESWPAERLDCGETYESEWECEPPPEIAALAFALPGDFKEAA